MFQVMEFDADGKLVPNGRRQLDSTKIDFHSLPHSGSSMIKRGVYPPGTTQAAVEAVVKGSFGGRFNFFRDGKFEYVAYTD